MTHAEIKGTYVVIQDFMEDGSINETVLEEFSEEEEYYE